MTNPWASESSRTASELSLFLSVIEGTGIEGDTSEWADFTSLLLRKHPGRADDVMRCFLHWPWELSLSQIRCGFHLWQSSELLTNVCCHGVCYTGQMLCFHCQGKYRALVWVGEWHLGSTPVKVGPASNRPLPLQSKDHFKFPLLAFHPPCQNGKATSFSTRETPNVYSCTFLCLPWFPVCALVTE